MNFYSKLWQLLIIIALLGGNAHALRFGKIFSKIPNPLRIFRKNIIDRFHTVQPNMFYRSGQLSQRALKKYIRKHKIKTVINLRGENPNDAWWHQENDVCRELGVNFFNIAMRAVTLTSKEKLLALLDIYDTAPKPILVHCQAGVDRTGEAAALWCMEKMGHSNKQAAQQLSISYFHNKRKYPAKDFLIKIWGGRKWLKQQYNPAHYRQFAQPET